MMQWDIFQLSKKKFTPPPFHQWRWNWGVPKITSKESELECGILNWPQFFSNDWNLLLLQLKISNKEIHVNPYHNICTEIITQINVQSNCLLHAYTLLDTNILQIKKDMFSPTWAISIGICLQRQSHEGHISIQLHEWQQCQWPGGWSWMQNFLD